MIRNITSADLLSTTSEPSSGYLRDRSPAPGVVEVSAPLFSFVSAMSRVLFLCMVDSLSGNIRGLFSILFSLSTRRCSYASWLDRQFPGETPHGIVMDFSDIKDFGIFLNNVNLAVINPGRRVKKAIWVFSFAYYSDRISAELFHYHSSIFS